VSYNVGDEVMLNASDYPQLRRHKLDPTFVGPFKVKRVLGPSTVELELPQRWAIHATMNVEKLKKYVRDTMDPQPGQHEGPAGPPVTARVPRAIVNEQVRYGQREFFDALAGLRPRE
jgi:hypothetical protein